MMTELDRSSTDVADVRRQRSAMMPVILGAFAVAAVLWLCVYFLLPPFSGMADPLARMAVALGCLCFAALFSLLLGVEAVAHERLQSAAIDPLSSHGTRRMTINARYLQNTLEQFVVFAPGLLGLAFFASDGRAMRAVVAVTVVWIAARWAFWIGYHRSPLYRAAGAPGMMQSLLVLLYVCCRFGYDAIGVAGAVGPVVLFVAIEAWLFAATRPPPG